MTLEDCINEEDPKKQREMFREYAQERDIFDLLEEMSAMIIELRQDVGVLGRALIEELK